MNGPDLNRDNQFRSAVIMTVVWVAGLTLAVIFVALFAGILLDKVLDSKPLFTVLLTVAGIPITIYLTFRVVKRAASLIQSPPPKDKSEEETHRGISD